MEGPLQITTLLYCFNERDEALLMHRSKQPNLGLWSPAGGKLDISAGESPHACAVREAREELGLSLDFPDLHLTGIVTETAFGGGNHWLMFLFEILPRMNSAPPEHREGRFGFFSRTALKDLPMPRTDREKMWPLFWEHRLGFFAARCHARPEALDQWVVEESRPAGARGICIAK